jgi:SAM-dependent methyltransferase
LHGPDYETEMAGMRRRATTFILPRIQRRFGTTSDIRVLDDGCGGGGTVQELCGNGVDCYGIDPGVRRAAWAELSMAERLCVADGTHLPFADQAFHVVLSSGVLEHVGEGDPNGPEAARRSYIGEMIRVLRPGGFALIAHPNGAHIIDYWHPVRGSVRWHWPYEGWMPAARDLRRWASLAGPPVSVRSLSPEGYLGFQRSRRYRYGRLLHPGARLLMKLFTVVPPLASSPLNPLLVTEVTRI